MVLKQSVSVERTNLTSVVRDVKGLVSFLSSSRPSQPDWSVFNFDDKWREVFEETRPQARLNV